MAKILVTYATMAGSTAEVARAVEEELVSRGLQADVSPIAEVKSLDGYSGVVVGAPMIMGFHRSALRFLRQHKKALSQLPLAIFVTAMSLTRTSDGIPGEAPVYVDEKLLKDPLNPDRLSFKEKYARLENYLKPIQRTAKPVSIGVFGGRLIYGKLPLWAVLFVILVIKATPGDHRNWDAIRSWAASLVPSFEQVGR